MGKLVMIQCSCGFCYDSYMLGVGMCYPDVNKKLKNQILYGKYGKYWKELMQNNSELDVDASYGIFQCDHCNNIASVYCLDLYKSESDYDYYTPRSEEVVYSFSHKCDKCGKRMKKIQIHSDEYGLETICEDIVYCLNCGKPAIISFCGHFD